MISAESFVRQAATRGFRLYTGVPCSYLTPFINYVIGSPDLRYVGATNEGDAIAIASGAELGGMPSVVMFQNSGLGNAVSPLTSLNAIFRMPVLVIATWRGQPGGQPDEPQHALMGQITSQLFDVMRIPWEYFPDDAAAIPGALDRAKAHMATTRTPYALIMKHGTVEPYELRRGPAAAAAPRARFEATPWPETLPSRQEVLAAVQAASGERDVLLATTGFTGRELFALGDRPNQLYMVGSMGCASSLGLGLALARPDKRVIVLDGDGAALMRMGAMGTVAHERPKNMVHVVLDNGAHESTGGQPTVSDTVDLGAVASACGYPRVLRGTDLGALGREIAASDDLLFVHVKTRAGVPAKLPRPTITPESVAVRFREALGPRDGVEE